MSEIRLLRCRVSRVSTLGPFEGLTGPDRQQLERLATLRRFGHGQVLYNYGDPAPDVLIVQSGLVAVEIHAGTERTLTVDLRGEGDFLGEMAIAGMTTRNATMRAINDVELLAIDIEGLRLLRISSQAIDEAALAILGGVIRGLTRRMVESTRLQQSIRLRRLLLRMQHHFRGGDIELTHEQLADMLGAQRTTVTELLAAEAAAGRIATLRGRIRVIDETALRFAAR